MNSYSNRTTNILSGLVGASLMAVASTGIATYVASHYTAIPRTQPVGEQYLQPHKLSYEIADRNNDGVNEFYFMYDGARLLAEEIKPVTAGYESVTLGFRVTPVEIIEDKPTIKPILHQKK